MLESNDPVHLSYRSAGSVSKRVSNRVPAGMRQPCWLSTAGRFLRAGSSCVFLITLHFSGMLNFLFWLLVPVMNSKWTGGGFLGAFLFHHSNTLKQFQSRSNPSLTWKQRLRSFLAVSHWRMLFTVRVHLRGSSRTPSQVSNEGQAQDM